MPIQKDYETPSTGAIANYHVAQQVSLDYSADGQTNVTVMSYLTKDAKDAGKFPLHTQQIQLSGLPASGQDARAYAYVALVVPAPTDGTANNFTNRYVFAGADIVA